MPAHEIKRPLRAIRKVTSRTPQGGCGPSEAVKNAWGNRLRLGARDPEPVVVRTPDPETVSRVLDYRAHGPTAQPVLALSAKEKAAAIGRSYTYVKDHAKELGGVKNTRGQWRFPDGA